MRGKFIWKSASSFSFVPNEALPEKGRYVIELPRSVRDSRGNVMSSDFISDFSLGSDFVLPVVTSSNPPSGDSAAEGIAVDTDITINFSRSMNRASVEANFSLSPSAAGYFIWPESSPESGSLVYRLTSSMDYGKLYSFTVSSDAEDLTGNKLGRDYRVNFITGEDFTPPEVSGIFSDTSGVYWTEGIINSGVERSVHIAFDFSENMDRQSVEDSFSVTPSLDGSFQWYGDARAVFTPSDLLEPETRYLISSGSSAKDAAGHRLVQARTAEILTDAPGSRYVKCGRISFSSDGITYINRPAGTPSPSDWPLPVDMGEDTNCLLWMRIEFVSVLTPYEPVVMKKSSVYGSCLIETFKGAAGSAYPSARIDDILWENSSTVIIKFAGMTNSPVYVPALYRFTLEGSASGVLDENDNYMKEDLIFEFREDES